MKEDYCDSDKDNYIIRSLVIYKKTTLVSTAWKSIKFWETYKGKIINAHANHIY